MNVQDARQQMNTIHGAPLSVISSCVRGFITAGPGNKLVACDLAAIEARVLAWLAGEEKVLEVFRTHGKIYEENAAGIYGIDRDLVDADQRQIGKVACLALGFQGGKVAFQSMAKNYGVKVTDERAEEIKVAWRAAHPNIESYWHRAEDASIAAVSMPGQKFSIGQEGREVTFLYKGSFLLCKLPSGRVIVYPYPRMKLITTPWGEKKQALTYKCDKLGHWVRNAAYGGLIVENITQAVARDLLRHAMFRWEEEGYPVVLHVHDELVAEVRIDSVKNIEEATRIMCEVPGWCKDLPLAADGWEGFRYRK